MTTTRTTYVMYLLKLTAPFLFFLALFVPAASAITIENVDSAITNDFVLTPSKTELFLDPGTSEERTLSVTNRTDRTITFSVSVEDFIGSHEEDNPVVLLQNGTSPYSLKDFIVPEADSFTLNSGERAIFSVLVRVPLSAEPTGRYGAVIVSTSGEGETTDGSNTRLVSRLGSLFLVRVSGNVIELGGLEDFRISGPEVLVRENADISFEVLYRNDGNVHTVPSGEITIRNMFGGIVETLPIDPYFVLPDSTRFRKIEWSGGFKLGRYKAELMLERGYNNNTDAAEIVFWVFPWKLFLIVLVILVALILVARFINRFEVRKKQ